MIVGHIHSMESMGLVDGPGIRSVVFFQGCALRCKFCHNPDTWEFQGGEEITPEALVKKISRFKPYFKQNGGVTFSGGEPLMQPEFLLKTLKLCRQEGIHTCIDTAGFGQGDYDEILSYTNLVLLDLKEITELAYESMTGRPMERFNEFLKALEQNGSEEHETMDSPCRSSGTYRQRRAHAGIKGIHRPHTKRRKGRASSLSSARCQQI